MATTISAHHTASDPSDDPPRSTTSTSSDSHHSSVASHFVPIRPAFRPLLPKPCASGIHTESLTSSISKGKEVAKKARKSASVNKKDTNNNNNHKALTSSRKRTKSESHAAVLPSTIAPSSLMSKRRRSPAGTASTSTATQRADIKNKNNALTIISHSSTVATSTFSNNATSPASPPSPPSLASSSTTTKSDSEQASIRSPSLQSEPTDIGVRINKKDVASNLMLSSGISDDLMFSSLSDGWISSRNSGRQIGSLSIWEETSDHESSSSHESGALALGSPEVGPISIGQNLSNDETDPSFISDSLISYSDSLLGSYLTPEPDDSEINSYAPLDFLCPPSH